MCSTVLVQPAVFMVVRGKGGSRFLALAIWQHSYLCGWLVDSGGATKRQFWVRQMIPPPPPHPERVFCAKRGLLAAQLRVSPTGETWEPRHLKISWRMDIPSRQFFCGSKRDFAASKPRQAHVTTCIYSCQLLVRGFFCDPSTFSNLFRHQADLFRCMCLF